MAGYQWDRHVPGPAWRSGLATASRAPHDIMEALPEAVPYPQKMATAIAVAKRDIAAVHEEATAILAQLKAAGTDIKPKHVMQFYKDIKETNPIQIRRTNSSSRPPAFAASPRFLARGPSSS